MALIDEFDCGKVHLAGHSMGGYLVQMAMCDYSREIASATSISGGSTVSDEAAQWLGWFHIQQIHDPGSKGLEVREAQKKESGNV